MVMRVRRVLGGTLALAAVVILVVSIGPHHTNHRPPVLTLVSMEPAGIFDYTGEMWLVTLSIVNPNNPPRPENSLYVKDMGISIEARVTNMWVGVEGTLACHLSSGQNHESLLLFPAGADYCRLSLQYTGSTPSFK